MFGLLIERYEHKLFHYIKRTINFPNQETEDILQEVFIKAYKNLNGFNPELKFSSWIYRITYNHTISYWRKHKNNQSNLSIEDSEVLIKTLSTNEDIPSDLAQQIESQAVREAINSLDNKYRDVLVLKFLEDKSYEEISDILKKPSGTIATLINRAKTKLKNKLI
jgi:RNA polymerase sigma-70 factor (ECF subfamily)